MENKWKNRKGIVYSTDPDFEYETENKAEQQTLPPERQNLKIRLDKKQRKGRMVTLIEGFTGREYDLMNLSRELKTKCSTGGTIKDGVVIIQGDFRDKINGLLKSKGFNVRII